MEAAELLVPLDFDVPVVADFLEPLAPALVPLPFLLLGLAWAAQTKIVLARSIWSYGMMRSSPLAKRSRNVSAPADSMTPLKRRSPLMTFCSRIAADLPVSR